MRHAVRTHRPFPPSARCAAVGRCHSPMGSTSPEHGTLATHANIRPTRMRLRPVAEVPGNLRLPSILEVPSQTGRSHDLPQGTAIFAKRQEKFRSFLFDRYRLSRPVSYRGTLPDHRLAPVLRRRHPPPPKFATLTFRTYLNGLSPTGDPHRRFSMVVCQTQLAAIDFDARQVR